VLLNNSGKYSFYQPGTTTALNNLHHLAINMALRSVVEMDSNSYPEGWLSESPLLSNLSKEHQQIIKDKSHGLNPFLVIATAGTTDTGAVDPLLEIGKIARENDLWYHIDAAYGGFFILTEQKKRCSGG
jgi:selenocysteine lyase/cysteine desulfurase